RGEVRQPARGRLPARRARRAAPDGPAAAAGRGTAGSMSWPEATQKLVHRLDAIRQTLEARFVARAEAVRLLLLAAVCREHLLLLGPPGTAKPELITRFAELIDARHFRYLLTRFTEPAEIFGPLDFQRFRDGEYHVRTSGMLPEANVVFLD